MKQMEHFAQASADFVRLAFRAYLQARDFAPIRAALHPELSWIGTGSQAFCGSYEDALRFLDDEEALGRQPFPILQERLEPIVLSERDCLVCGEFQLAALEAEGRPALTIRIYVLCRYEAERPYFYQINYSVQQTEQAQLNHAPAQHYAHPLEAHQAQHKDILDERNRQLLALSNSIMGGVQIRRADDDLTILFCNDGFLSLIGYTQETLTQQQNRHSAFVHPPDLPLLHSEIRRHLAENKSFSVEYRIVHKNGQLLWVLDKGVFLQEADGTWQIHCVLTDITKQKEQELALRLSEKRYEMAMNLSGIAMFEYNIQTRELTLYGSLAQSYNMPSVIPDGPEELIRSGVIEPVSVAPYREMYRKIHEGAPYAQTYIGTRTTQNEVHSYQLSLTTIYDDDGTALRAIGVRKNVSEVLRLQRERAFGQTLATGKTFICEANVSRDTLIYIHEDWQRRFSVQRDTGFSAAISFLCEHLIAPEHHKLVASALSRESIEKAFQQQDQLIHLQYLRRNESSQEFYNWYEGTVNIIRDEESKDLSIRLYHRNIHEQKLTEQRAEEERSLYETMVARSVHAYEVNITKNSISGNEKWDALFGITPTNTYSEMVLAFADASLLPQDRAQFCDLFHHAAVLAAYNNGERQLRAQYRSQTSATETRWYSCTQHLFEDPKNGDIKAFAYIEDIDEQKRAELALRYDAAHDKMTSLYNKSTTELNILAYLQQAGAQQLLHALLVVDIDHFKSVNDQFGHLFGDQVLTELADTLREMFRIEDIVGRIGGDEFCVLMKQLPNRQSALDKAQEICDRLRRAYRRGPLFAEISASVGVAFYSAHGTTYPALFQHADAALYTIKNSGRGGFSC